ncbi:uncharacterized protein LOC110858617 isoform X2 [Folsomia candida]|nr:uncharacterized protein LOC110858617 isoform X2 [Folsomia candida]
MTSSSRAWLLLLVTVSFLLASVRPEVSGGDGIQQLKPQETTTQTGQGGGEGVKRGEEEEERVPLEKLPQIIRQHLIQKLNITAPVQQGRGFFDALGTAVGAGMKLAYHAADAVTFGATTSLIDKAKEAAINVAIDAYTSGMLNKRDVGEAEAGLDPPLSN